MANRRSSYKPILTVIISALMCGVAMAQGFHGGSPNEFSYFTHSKSKLDTKSLINDRPIYKTMSFALGVGHSKHASSYYSQETLRQKEYSGFRAIFADVRAGLNYDDNFSVLANVNFSPSNTIFSPYQSVYGGVLVTKRLGLFSPFILMAGVGHTWTTVDEGKLGNGRLFNAGLSYELENNLFLEFRAFKGKIDDSRSINPGAFDTEEFGWYVTLNFQLF